MTYISKRFQASLKSLKSGGQTKLFIVLFVSTLSLVFLFRFSNKGYLRWNTRQEERGGLSKEVEDKSVSEGVKTKAGKEGGPFKKEKKTQQLKKKDQSKLKQRFPQAIIAGFSKCGTHVLRSFLKLHPDVVASDDEVRYFYDEPKYASGRDWYLKQMPLSLPHQITIEKTPMYITSKLALYRIYHFNSAMKFILTVRDPVTRIPSWYAQAQSYKEFSDKNTSFYNFVMTAIDKPKNATKYGPYVLEELTSYFPFVKNAYEIFSQEQVLVVSEEDLVNSPYSVLLETEEFLGLRHAFSENLFVYNEQKSFYCFNTSHRLFKSASDLPKLLNKTSGCFNGQKGREHDSYVPDLYRKVVLAVHENNEQLFELIGKRFNWTSPKDL